MRHCDCDFKYCDYGDNVDDDIVSDWFGLLLLILLYSGLVALKQRIQFVLSPLKWVVVCMYLWSMSAHVLMCCNKISVLTLNMQLFVEFHVNHALVWFRFPSSICVSCIRIRIRILALSFHAQWQFMRASHFRIDNTTWNGISKLVNNINWNNTMHENKKLFI